MKFCSRAFAAALTLGGAAPVVAAPGDIFPRNVVAEKVWGEGRFTEGVDVAPDGRVYFADMAASASIPPPLTLLFDPVTRKITVFLSGNGNSNGQKIGPDGQLWSVQATLGGTRDVRVVSLHGGKRRVVVSGYAGHPFNSPNDLAFDAAGRLYVTDVRYAGAAPIEQPLNGVYRIDPDGRVTLIIADMLAPNGIAISPNGETLYVSEYPYRSAHITVGTPAILPTSIRAYDLTPEGRAIHGRAFVEFGAREGADGMTVDAKGNLVSTYRDSERRGVRVFSPSGEEIDFLPLPEKPTNLAFGTGAERNILYITAGRSLYRVATNTGRASH
jgi:gluconolactonase